MAHLFADNTTEVTGDFELGMQPFDYGNCATFTANVDLSVAGMVQDCGECHVGGGAMEYVPAPTMAGRTSLRNITTANVNNSGSINATKFTAFNYFIDTYDVDNDDDLREALYMDWQKTGVLEMDCLLCHLEGYDYDARIAMQRDAKFDASRAVAAGVAAPNTAPWGDTDYGIKVTYNNLVEDDGSGNYTFNSTVLMGIKAAPPSENCAFCHANWPGVDWKKRGDSWRNVRTDAHYVLQCMGCHQGKVGSVIGTSGNATAGPDYKDLGQCDPAKASPPYSSNWNPKDNSVKTCEDCHLRAGYDSGLDTYSPDYGAPDPTGTHEYYGLLGEICQTGTDGNMTIHSASHLDIIDCAACHVRKIGDEAWNTGGAMVDATGPDHEGRLTDHENDYVLRDMEENLCYTWQNGKVIPSSALTTIFYRDTNDSVDINNDGRPDGMDPPLMPDVLQINIDNGWTTMSMDLSGNITKADIDARITGLNDGLKAGADIKLCAMTVPFRVTHNVSPASYALGHSCDDCHGAAAGIFNGDYRLQGDAMTLSYNATAQTTGLTKVNPTDDKTDVHGNMKTKLGNRSIARRVFSGVDSMPPVNRSEFLYEDDLTISSGNIKAVTSPYTVYTTRAGWVNYLNTLDLSGCNSWPDAVASSTGPYNVKGLRGYGIGCNCGNSTHPDFEPAGGGVGPTGIVYGVNATGDHCVAPSPWDIYEVTAYTDINFHAEDVCGGEYYWNFNDASGFVEGTQFSAVGQNPTHNFRDLGIFKVVLTVKNLYGNVDSTMILVNVVKP